MLNEIKNKVRDGSILVSSPLLFFPSERYLDRVASVIKKRILYIDIVTIVFSFRYSSLLDHMIDNDPDYETYKNSLDGRSRWRAKSKFETDMYECPEIFEMIEKQKRINSLAEKFIREIIPYNRLINRKLEKNLLSFSECILPKHGIVIKQPSIKELRRINKKFEAIGAEYILPYKEISLDLVIPHKKGRMLMKRFLHRYSYTSYTRSKGKKIIVSDEQSESGCKIVNGLQYEKDNNSTIYMDERGKSLNFAIYSRRCKILRKGRTAGEPVCHLDFRIVGTKRFSTIESIIDLNKIKSFLISRLRFRKLNISVAMNRLIGEKGHVSTVEKLEEADEVLADERLTDTLSVKAFIKERYPNFKIRPSLFEVFDADFILKRKIYRR